MAVVVEEEREAAGNGEGNAPSSPPDLSYSKSSKSSSRSGDSDTDENVSMEKLEQLDEGSVDERDEVEHRDDSNLRAENRPTLRRPPQRSSFSPPLTMKEQKYPSLKGAVSGVLRDQSLSLPQRRGLRRGVTSPASPSFTMGGAQKTSSRSPSPKNLSRQSSMTISPQTYTGANGRLSTELRSPNTIGNMERRKSWQPGRKSVKQLEAECDNLDEEVPDEAVLENVPISPMPGQTRLSPRTSRSTTPSPHRRPPPQQHSTLHSVPSHTNLHSAKVPKNAKRPSAPTIMPNGQYGSPRSPRHVRPPMLQHSNTMPSHFMDPLMRRHRSKSWTEDLNEEAKALSAALEEYADRKSVERHGSGANSVSSSPPRADSMPKIQRAKTTIMDMPPLSYGSVMIDPLPSSKEKEAVLSKTRPSWLPPKDQKEDKKHIKEWEAMMARAAENERKRQLKEREAQEDSDEMKDNLARIWEQHVLQNWDIVIAEPRTRELWWRGVTPKSRGVVWQKAIGNELQLNVSSFEAALNRANALEEKTAQMSPDDRAGSDGAAWFAAIARDVPVTCPELREAEERTQFESALRDVLKAYAIYRRDVGYVYGTHLIAGLLCLHLRPVDAFISLANMLNRPLPLAFLAHDVTAMGRAYELVMSTLKYKLPRLHDHLVSDSILAGRIGEILDPMFRCLFAYHLPVGHVSRLWDVFAFEGDKVLIRAAVAVLVKLEPRLYGSREEILNIVGWQNEKGLDLGSEEEFMNAVRDAGKVDGRKEEVKPVYV
ncbi:uncharacterized protein LTR77_010165 [Saxophila tyrrhenica]|uniref:Rab-GAP TBC domain-containing protein n=1 Tax=Saxophila tyrrhenica TaxID=1690608 RepID=A0AAV9NW38_9PEZI|nr:hypothetical protein LTR77_010165 [Saxophila tyrrhenica]